MKFFSATPRGKFRAWLWGITRNNLADFHNRMAETPAVQGGTAIQMFLGQLADAPPEDSDPSEQQTVVSQLLHRAILQLKNDFQEHTWQAFWRTMIGQEATSDVARELGMTPKAVRQARHRILSRFRLELDGLLD